MNLTFSVSPEAVRDGIERLASKIIRKITTDIHAAIITAINSGPKTGRLYRVRTHSSEPATDPSGLKRKRKRKRSAVRWHRASAPGEAPATNSGHLIGSIQITPNLPPLIGEVTIGAEYARYLEEGAPRAHLEPRPYVNVSIQGVIQKLGSSRGF